MATDREPDSETRRASPTQAAGNRSIAVGGHVYPGANLSTGDFFTFPSDMKEEICQLLEAQRSGRIAQLDDEASLKFYLAHLKFSGAPQHADMVLALADEINRALGRVRARLPSLEEVYVPNQLAERGSASTSLAWTRALRSAIDRHSVILIEAGPGVGKGTMLSHIAYGTAHEAMPSWIPVRVSALELLGRPLHQALSEHVTAAMGEELAHLLPDSLFGRPPAQGDAWLVLVEDLDQVLDSRERARLLTTLKTAAQLGLYRAVVTTRPLPPGNDPELRAIGRYELLPFGPVQTVAFIRRWFQVERRGNHERYRERQADQFLGAAQQHGFADLTDDVPFTIPLFLALAALACDDGPVFQERQAALYERIVAILLTDAANISEARGNFRRAWRSVFQSPDTAAADRVVARRGELLERLAGVRGWHQGSLQEITVQLAREEGLLPGDDGQANTRHSLEQAMCLLLEDTRLVTRRGGHADFVSAEARCYLAASALVPLTETAARRGERPWKRSVSRIPPWQPLVPRWLTTRSDEPARGKTLIAALGIASWERHFGLDAGEPAALVRRLAGVEERPWMLAVAKIVRRNRVLRFFLRSAAQRRGNGLLMAGQVATAGMLVSHPLEEAIVDKLIANVRRHGRDYENQAYFAAPRRERGLRILGSMRMLGSAAFVTSSLAELVRDDGLPEQLRQEGITTLLQLAATHALNALAEPADPDARINRSRDWNLYGAYGFDYEDYPFPFRAPHNDAGSERPLPTWLRYEAAVALLKLGHRREAIGTMWDQPSLAARLRLEGVKEILPINSLDEVWQVVKDLTALAGAPKVEESVRQEATRLLMRTFWSEGVPHSDSSELLIPIARNDDDPAVRAAAALLLGVSASHGFDTERMLSDAMQAILSNPERWGPFKPARRSGSSMAEFERFACDPLADWWSKVLATLVVGLGDANARARVIGSLEEALKSR